MVYVLFRGEIWYFPESAGRRWVLARVREVAHLLPLHNYAEADVIEILPRTLQWSVCNRCDTSFPLQYARKGTHRYALPRDVVDKFTTSVSMALMILLTTAHLACNQ